MSELGLTLLVAATVAGHLAALLAGRQRAVRAITRALVRDLREGEVVNLVGKVDAAEGGLLEAPLSGRRCAHFWVVVQGALPGVPMEQWRVLVSRSESCDFMLRDPSGRVRVSLQSQGGTGLVKDDVHELTVATTRNARHRAILGAQERSLLPHPVLFTEGVLEEGELVAVRGQVRSETGVAGEASASFREASRRLVIGPGPDGELLVSDDLRVLREWSHPIAAAAPGERPEEQR